MFTLFPGGIVKCVGRLARSASPSGCFGWLSSSSSSTPASLPPSTTTNPSGLTTSRSTPISSLSASSPARCCWRCTLLAFPATWCPCSTGNVLKVHQRFIFVQVWLCGCGQLNYGVCPGQPGADAPRWSLSAPMYQTSQGFQSDSVSSVHSPKYQLSVSFSQPYSPPPFRTLNSLIPDTGPPWVIWSRVWSTP